MAIRQPHAYLPAFLLRGIKPGVTFGLRPVQQKAILRETRKRYGYRFNLVNNRLSVFLKNSVCTSLHRIAKILPVLRVRKMHLSPVAFPALSLKAAMNARPLCGAIQRAARGAAFQISAAQKKLHQLPH